MTYEEAKMQIQAIPGKIWDLLSEPDREAMEMAFSALEKQILPSAQPEMNFDEWCTDCKEYDHEKHCCPRWNRVIRQTLKDAQPQYTELTPEEAASEIASGSIMSASYWLDAMIRLKQMGYAICRKKEDR